MWPRNAVSYPSEFGIGVAAIAPIHENPNPVVLGRCAFRLKKPIGREARATEREPYRVTVYVGLGECEGPAEDYEGSGIDTVVLPDPSMVYHPLWVSCRPGPFVPDEVNLALLRPVLPEKRREAVVRAHARFFRRLDKWRREMKVDLGRGPCLESRNAKFHQRIVRVTLVPNTRSGHNLDLEWATARRRTATSRTLQSWCFARNVGTRKSHEPTKVRLRRRLHYADPYISALTEDLVARLGENVRVTRLGDNRAWMAPRHYVALHGLKSTNWAPTSSRPSRSSPHERKPSEPPVVGLPRVPAHRPARRQCAIVRDAFSHCMLEIDKREVDWRQCPGMQDIPML